jgi:hypothetical protein
MGKVETQMATYKYLRLLSLDSSTKFDDLSDAGVSAPHPGIYRCEECGREIVIAQSHNLPPETHHSHSLGQGRIRWRLAVSHN